MAEHEHEHEHERGNMDSADHQKTFDAFIRFWVYLFGSAIGILIFLALFNT